MLTFVLLLTFVAFAISAGIEYWIVSSSKTIERWYTSDGRREKLYAMAVSIAISLFFGALVGTGAGGGVYTGMVIMLSTGLGFATNTLTYNFFQKMGRFNVKRRKLANDWRHLKETRPQVVNDFWSGLVAVGKVIAGFFIFVGMILRGFGWLVNTMPNKIRQSLRARSLSPFRRHAA